jgi:hypothetical protein
MADLVPLVIVQNASWTRVFTITNDDGTISDLSDCTARMTVRTAPSTTAPVVLEMSSLNGLLSINGPAATITAGELSPTQTGAAALVPNPVLPPPLGVQIMDPNTIFSGYGEMMIKNSADEIIDYFDIWLFTKLTSTQPF